MRSCCTRFRYRALPPVPREFIFSTCILRMRHINPYPAGHPEAHIHSGESAVITPRLVTGLGRRQVLAVAAAKHHTVFCTTAGEVYTMGSNRHGQLGYAVDTQPTPRRCGGAGWGGGVCDGRRSGCCRALVAGTMAVLVCGAGRSE